MWRGTILSLALVVIGCRGSAVEPGDDWRPEFLAQCSALQAEIYEQRQVVNALFTDQLREGVETGAWLEADRLAALETHAEVLAPIPTETVQSSDVLRRSKAKRTPERSAELPVATLRATTAVESWFLLQRYYLDVLFDSVTHSQAQAAVEYAESVWLKARKAGDLAVALRPLLDARERGVRWPMAAQQRRSEGSGLRLRFSLKADALYTFDAWTIIASPDGLLPPDPDTATTVEFSRWRDTWLAVRQTGNTFVIRPYIAARAADILARRKEAETRGVETVNRLILEDVPVAKLEEALSSISHLVGTMELPGRNPGSAAVSAFGPIRDYRDLLTDVNSPPRTGPRTLPGASSDWFAACNLYTRWRKTAALGAKEADKLQSELQRSLQTFPPRVAGRIRKQLATPATAEQASGEVLMPEIVPGQETETLAAALDKLVREGGQRTRDFTALARVARGEPAGRSGDDAVQRVDSDWLTLAGLPQARQLIPLRDAAIRAQLQKYGIATASDPPQTVLWIWREAMAKEAETGRFEVVDQLLGLDRRFSIAPAAEADEWSQVVAMIKSARADARSKDVLRSQLLRTTSPAVMRVIALKLKAAGGG